MVWKPLPSATVALRARQCCRARLETWPSPNHLYIRPRVATRTFAQRVYIQNLERNSVDTSATTTRVLPVLAKWNSPVVRSSQPARHSHLVAQPSSEPRPPYPERRQQPVCRPAGTRLYGPGNENESLFFHAQPALFHPPLRPHRHARNETHGEGVRRIQVDGG